MEKIENWSKCAKAAAACGAIVVFGALYLLNRQRPQVWVIQENVLLVMFAMAVAAAVGAVCGVVVLARGSSNS